MDPKLIVLLKLIIRKNSKFESWVGRPSRSESGVPRPMRPPVPPSMAHVLLSSHASKWKCN